MTMSGKLFLQQVRVTPEADLDRGISRKMTRLDSKKRYTIVTQCLTKLTSCASRMKDLRLELPQIF